jgi:hypothetical protein
MLATINKENPISLILSLVPEHEEYFFVYLGYFHHFWALKIKMKIVKIAVFSLLFCLKEIE